MTAESDVLRTAEDLVAAFGEHRVDDYFACFDPDATFVFYNAEVILRSRAEYRELWHRWEREQGFRVLSCRSTDPTVQLLGDAAVFTHHVHTKVETAAGTEALDERETIIFARRGDRWVAVHEHLSPAPGAQ